MVETVIVITTIKRDVGYKFVLASNGDALC